MSQHTDPHSHHEPQDALKVPLSVKREQPDPRESNGQIPGWLLAISGALICFAGVYFGIYHGGFRGDVFNEVDSSPQILFAQKQGPSAQTETAVELSLVEQGKAVYSNCQPCHQSNGMGVPGQFPPLAGSEWVSSEKRLIAILLKGISGPMKVGSASYNGAMPAWEKTLSDKKIAAVASYIRATWGNAAPEISEAKVAAAKLEFAAQQSPWTEAELLNIPADATIDAPSSPTGADAGQTPAPAAKPVTVDLAAGKDQYSAICAACHQPTGAGLPPVFPPLINSEYVSGDPERLVAIILKGVMGPIEVDGKAYNNMMPAQGMVLTDTKISQVASYVRDSFGNKASPVTVDMVKAVRARFADRQNPWTEAELKAFSSPQP